jgi:hypothetical protein
VKAATTDEVLRDLLRAKLIFQQRALQAIIEQRPPQPASDRDERA